MSIIVFSFTREGVVVADGAVAAARAMEFARSGEATVVIVKAANDAAPAADMALNMQALGEFTSAVTAGSADKTIKSAFATALGTLAGMGALPALGPAGALAFGEGFARIYESAHDAASAWSANQNWGPLFDLIDDLKDFAEKIFTISPSIGTTPDPLVKTIRYVDPLVLDMDGDGLEIAPLSAGVLFDANGDAIKTGTAWVKPDDALLVWDRNRNGLIDSGRELFGDETLLANGQKASHGFAALAELDSNADGQFDKLDARFNDLRLWFDLNQDGISQTNELQTLDAAGVQSIALNSTTTNKNFGDALLVQTGTFTRIDAQGQSSQSQAGSFILAQNNFTRQFSPIEVSAEAKTLTPLVGSGWVRDLREAATQNTDLIGLFNDLKSTTSRSEFREAVEKLLLEWGSQSAYESATQKGLKEGYGLILSDPLDDQERGWMDMAIKANESERTAFRETLNTADQTKFDAMRERMVGGLEKLYAYEAFTGHTFLQWSQVLGDAQNYIPRFTSTGSRAVEVWVPFSRILEENRNGFLSDQPGYIRVNIPTPRDGQAHLDTLWNRLVDDATQNLIPVRVSSCLDLISLNVEDNGIGFDFSALNAHLHAVSAQDPLEGALLLWDVYKTHGNTLDGMGWNSQQHILDLFASSATTPEIKQAFPVFGINYVSTDMPSTNGTDCQVGNADANALNSGLGNDWVLGLAGDDSLNGDGGNDTLDGGQGDDVINGGSGHDVLVGGAGNDYLDGGKGNDVYRYRQGDGNDTIVNRDNSYGRFDLLQLDDLNATDIRLEKVQATNHLKVVVKSSGEAITLDSFFYSPHYSIDAIQFADGTVWKRADMLANFAVYGTAANDTLTGVDGINTRLFGFDGADNLTGGSSSDTLDGGQGDDVINGGAGHDLIVGGAGNDYLDGGSGQDVYRYRPGDGNDTIVNRDNSYGRFDLLQLDDLNATDIRLEKVQGTNHLKVAVKSSGEAITLDSFFYSSTYSIDAIQFADGARWSRSDLLATTYGTAGNDTLKVLTGTNTRVYSYEGADQLTGNTGHDFLDGDVGNDILHGGAGNDVLIGGQGDDVLDGGTGSDAYIYMRGDGNDVINNQDSSAERSDTLLLKDLNTIDIRLEKATDTNHLQVVVKETGQSITLIDFFLGSANSIDLIQFANGTRWLRSDMLSNFAIHGKTSDDVLTGVDGINTPIYGYAGNDQLQGCTGNDTLNGGLGDDLLDGGTGNDLYVYRLGDGNDTIINRDSSLGRVDTLVLENLNSDGIRLENINGTQHLKVLIKQNRQSITLADFFEGSAASIDVLQLANGQRWNRADMLANFAVHGSSGNDILNAVDGVDTPLFGYEGSDTLMGHSGNDTLDGGLGNDLLWGDAGNDSLKGNVGNDTLNGDSGNDALEAGTGDDVLVGGTGNDVLNGGWGSDRYIYRKGDGNDTITDRNTHAGRADTLVLEDLNATDVQLEKVQGANHLKIVVKDTDEAVTLNGFFGPVAYTLDVLEFHDGTRWLRADMLAHFAVYGTQDKDLLTGVEGVDTPLYGFEGGDQLMGRSGNDILDGGAGNDKLNGGKGSDTYIYRKGDGSDTITDNDMTVDCIDTLILQDLTASDIRLEKVIRSNDLKVVTKETGDAITLEDFFDDSNRSVEIIQLADGTRWNRSELRTSTFGTTKDDVLKASTTGPARLYGYEGADKLNGGAANDLLEGGSGNDTLNGGSGNDTYVFNAGFGSDVLIDFDRTPANSDVVMFGKGITAEQLKFRQSNNHLEVSVFNTDDSLTVNNWFVSKAWQIEAFKTSDGRVLRSAAVQSYLEALTVAQSMQANDSYTLTDYQLAMDKAIRAHWL